MSSIGKEVQLSNSPSIIFRNFPFGKRYARAFFTCFWLLGLGSITVSSYVCYKLWRLRGSLTQLEKQMSALAMRLDQASPSSQQLPRRVQVQSPQHRQRSSSHKTSPARHTAKKREPLVTPPSSNNYEDDSDSDLLIMRNTQRTKAQHQPLLVESTEEDASLKQVKAATAPKKQLNFKLPQQQQLKPIESSEDLVYYTPCTSPTDEFFQTTDSLLKQSQDSSKEADEDNKTYDDMLSKSYEEKSVECIKNELKYLEDENNFVLCLNYIKALYVLGEAEKDGDTKKSLRTKAYELAKKSIDLNSDSYLAYKWLAMTTGRIVDNMGMNDKIKYGFEFKSYLDIAIKLNKNDYLLYYLRGRWTFKISSLSWAEKAACRIVFGSVPSASIDDAFNDFQTVQRLHKNKSKGNLLYLAKCLINQNNIRPALEHLKFALELPIRTEDHVADNKEIASLLQKYSNSYV